MKKIAIVVHRYGKEIGSGAESYAMQMAEKLKDFYKIDVLTTTCFDYMTWDNYYPEGSTMLDGINVLRFKTIKPRMKIEFDKLSLMQLEKINAGEPTEINHDKKWIDLQGPNCPDMLSFIKEQSENYHAFIFLTYIYYHFVCGMPLVAHKSLVIPTVHDEPWIRQSIYRELFCLPRFFCFLTEEERNFTQTLFKNQFIKSDVVGFGFEPPKKVCPDDFKKKNNIKGKYIIYVGRIDISKCCDEMISYFIEYKKNYPSDLKLVLIGKPEMDIPKQEDIITTGFVDEQAKFDAIAGASFMIAPSEYESFCISLMESFLFGVPALVNGRCSVLRGHCDRSGSGLYYTTKKEFIDYANQLLTSPDNNKVISENAIRYINDNYTWKKVIKKLCYAIEYAAGLIQSAQGNEFNEVKDVIGYTGRNLYEDEQLIATVLKSDTAIIPAFDDGVVVLFAANNAYACFLGVLIQSIIENASPSRNYDLVILIDDDMNVRNVNLITSLGKNFNNISIRFINVCNLSKLYNFDKIKTNYNKYTYYRFFMFSVMANYSKVLYLDSDTLVNTDISLLYDTDITNYDLAAAFDVLATCWQILPNEMFNYFHSIGLNEPGKYLQAGVVLFNIKQMNQEYKHIDIMNKALSKKYILHDQDFLNVLCKGKVKYLEQEWNVFNFKNETADIINRYLPTELYSKCIKARNNPKIIHYSERQFPCYNPDADFNYLYWKYARNTPFYENLISIMTKIR
jgi:lipopolysaccharide biosynthesis glycosyltransferase/glycosyltransferase involved in cell wall biosynthesis